MPIYNYIASDNKGNRINGSVEARSKDLAISLIKQKNLLIISINEKRETFVGELLDFRGVPKSEIVSFTRQFSTMISAGVAISNALEVLINQTTNTKFRSALIDVLNSVEGGYSLSNSLSRHPSIFSKTYYSLVVAGESSGSLDVILSRLADKLEEDREIESKFKGAMVYPIIVTIAMAGVFFGLMLFVIPRLAQMYRDLDVELPFITQLMINFSDFLVNNLLFVLLSIIGAILGFRYYSKTPSGSAIISEITFMIPIFGRINKLKDLEQFTSTLALLMSSAVPIVDSLNIVSEVVSNRAYRDAAKDAAIQVEKGKLLSDYFKSSSVFPNSIGQMAGVGEETGKMDEILEKVSTYFKSELNHLIAGLSAALEPVILLVLGVGVGFLIISIITPIYKITTAI